ncbi:hypothetical protein BCY86_04275 [Pajaroellobacter abortibovis]|uniref:Transporter n=2 Tax=Pajaroellobacter abortibovis TaxID=1882918 RepID=A0A1L6MX26_9BACT|nr:hypothetical protein BCY86_04275 [Pajaroellobacter abortibovis]
MGSSSTSDPYSAWWTGTLFSVNGHTIPAGHVVVQPYLMASKKFAQPNRIFSIHPLFAAMAGITNGLDLQVIVHGSTTFAGNRSSTQLGDSALRLAFQLLEANNTNWHPDIMFFVKETFPTGNYDSLDPNLKWTDASGTGAYATTVSFNFQKIVLMPNQHPLRLRLNMNLQASSKAKARGASVYGTIAENAKGYAYPGENVLSIFGVEYHLTKRWVVALDLYHSYQASSRFRGNPGVRDDSRARTSELVTPYSHTFGFAPALEYNFNVHLGIIGGCDISIFGRDQYSLASLMPTIALTIYR